MLSPVLGRLPSSGLFTREAAVWWREHVPCQERLTELEVFSLDLKRLGDFINVGKYLMWVGIKEDEIRLLPLSREWTKGNKHQLKSHNLNVRSKKSLSNGVVEQWNRLPGETVEFPTFETLRI